jgi:hypothetical protein
MQREEEIMNLRSFKPRVRSQERGITLPLVGIMLIALLGFAALAVDVGFWRYSQQVEQSAADSAAIAGANALAFPSASYATAATTDATTNGFTADGGVTTTVQVNKPPATGPNAGNANAVEVLISKKQPNFLAQFVPGFSSQWVSVRAVAVLNTTAIDCIYALKVNVGVNLNGGGRGGISAPTCGMIVNQDLSVTGNANVDALSIGYVGTGPGGGTYPEGQPMKAVPAADPCQTITSCAYLASLTSTQLHTGCVDSVPLNPNALPPGEYCNAVSGSVTLVPTATNALYVFDQGMPTGSATGTGVTIYNLGSGLTWNGGVNSVFSAPTTGPTAGTVFYQPPSNTSNITKNGAAGNINFIGGFYAPTANFTWNGNLPSLTYIVAGSITMNGGGMTVAGPGTGFVSGHGVLSE